MEIGRTFRGPVDRALINGAPVAAPVTMQFALHRDAYVYIPPVYPASVCLHSEGGEREARGRDRGWRNAWVKRARCSIGAVGTGDDENGRVYRRSGGICSEVTKP